MHFGTANADAALGVAADGSSRPVAAACFQGSLTLGDTMLTSQNGTRDGVVFRLVP